MHWAGVHDICLSGRLWLRTIYSGCGKRLRETTPAQIFSEYDKKEGMFGLERALAFSNDMPTYCFVIQYNWLSQTNYDLKR